MKALLTVLAGLMMSAPALADIDYGFEVGVRQQSADVNGAEVDAQVNTQFGISAHVPMSGALHLRTGMLYTLRNFKMTPTGTSLESKVETSYLDVPVTLMYKFEEYMGIYGGVILALNVDKKNVTDIQTPLIPFVFGATFKFAPNFGANVYFEQSGKAAQGLDSTTAVGANLMITFD